MVISLKLCTLLSIRLIIVFSFIDFVNFSYSICKVEIKLIDRFVKLNSW